jgi:hypothetical protein
VKKWVKKGLKEEILLKLKEKIVSTFAELKLRGRV